jgi:beta-glucanase (GH16 family)
MHLIGLAILSAFDGRKRGGLEETTLRTVASFRLRRVTAWLGILPVLVSVSCSSAAGSPESQSSPWKQVWADNFDGPANGSVNTAYWGFDTGRGVFGTGEVETMTSSPSNVHLDSHGNLVLVALGHGAASSGGATWTSARLKTKSLFGAPAGGQMMVTASIKQPDPANALGYWPGFWMLGPGRWPGTGEIDVLEDVNGLSREAGTLHCGNLSQHNPDGTSGPCHEGTGLGSGLRPCPGCQQDFHTYTVIVDRRHAGDEQIRWYLDGHEFFSIGESRVGQTVWTAAVDHGFAILLSLAVGGSYPDNQCGCSTPDSQTSSGGMMEIRYVRVYTT